MFLCCPGMVWQYNHMNVYFSDKCFITFLKKWPKSFLSKVIFATKKKVIISLHLEEAMLVLQADGEGKKIKKNKTDLF